MSLIWNPEESATILEMPLEVIKTGTQDMGDGIYWLKAGTPLDEYFAVSNDEDAKYIVAEDFKFISTKPDQAKIVPLITAGYVDLNKAEAASGLTYTDACLSALETAGIVMVDGTISGGGGSSGGGVLVVHIDAGEVSVLDKTWQEIHDAFAQGTPCATLYVDDADVVQGHISTVSVSGPPDSKAYGVYSIVAQGDTVVIEKWVASSADGYPAFTE